MSTAKKRISDALKQVSILLKPEVLRACLLEPISDDTITETLQQIAGLAPPSYLPFAKESDGIFAFHLWPGRPIEISPIVYLQTDDHHPQFVCDSLKTLPRSIWLWTHSYFSSDREEFSKALSILVQSIPGALPIPNLFWSNFLETAINRWSYRHSLSNKIWSKAEVGHPFAGAPDIDKWLEPEKAVPMLSELIRSRPDSVELRGALIGALSQANRPIDESLIVPLISAEAWRRYDHTLTGYWREKGNGLCEWDTALSSFVKHGGTFSDPAFSALISEPNTFSGENQRAHLCLLEVSVRLQRDGNHSTALRQLRNATLMSILYRGHYDTGLATALLASCRRIAPDSIASDIVEHSIEAIGP